MVSTAINQKGSACYQNSSGSQDGSSRGFPNIPKKYPLEKQAQPLYHRRGLPATELSIHEEDWREEHTVIITDAKVCEAPEKTGYEETTTPMLFKSIPESGLTEKRYKSCSVLIMILQLLPTKLVTRESKADNLKWVHLGSYKYVFFHLKMCMFYQLVYLQPN